jgi:ribose transport system substrate-binding protein
MAKTKVLTGLVVLAALLLAQAAWAAPGVQAVNPPKGSGVVYYLQFDMINGFNIGSGQYMEKFGKELGYTMKLLNARGNATEQINQMDTAISQKPRAIIIKPVEANTIVAAVNKAREAGIPVLSYDGTITDTTVELHSVVGTEKIGQMAAEETIKILKARRGGEKGKVLQVMGDLGDFYTIFIDKGFRQVMARYPNVTVITKDTPGWENTVTANVVSDQLTANKDIDVIFVHADSRLPAVIPVLEAKGLKKGAITLLGTDGDPSALQLIRDGWLKETIGVPMVQQVFGEFAFLDRILAKKKLAAGQYDIKGVAADLVMEKWGPTLYLPGQIIDRSNVDDPALWGNIKF